MSSVGKKQMNIHEILILSSSASARNKVLSKNRKEPTGNIGLAGVVPHRRDIISDIVKAPFTYLGA